MSSLLPVLLALGLAEPSPGPPSALAASWEALADRDARVAYRASWSLVAAGDAACEFLADQLKPVKEDPGRVAQWIAHLDSDSFHQRERATRELARLGAGIVPALREALRGSPSLELRRRVERLLAQLSEDASPVLTSAEGQRAVRAVAVLERIGTDRAREVLKDLAGGVSTARLTREARASLRRLAE